MYNQSYDDYLRNVLGIQHNYNNTYANTNYNRDDFFANDISMNATYNTYGMSREQLESCFPLIYNIINPLVIRTWNINTKPITNELIEQVTEQIYDTVADHDRRIKLNINLTNAVRGSESSNETENRESKVEVRHSSEDTQPNYLLKDLIRILLVKDLIERQNNMQPNRPPIRPFFSGDFGTAIPIMPRYRAGM